MGRWAFFLLLFASACGHSPYPGFKAVGDDVYLRYHVLGDGDALVQDEDSMHMLVRVAELGEDPGSLLSTQRWYAGDDLRHGALIPVLRRMHIGDSISLITRSVALPWEALAPASWNPPLGATEVQLEFVLLDIHTPAMIEAEQQRHRTADPQGYERKLIAAFMGNAGHVWTRWGTSQLHYRINGVASDTARVQAGDRVEISWRGFRLEDGVEIDDTQANAGPFSFRYGDQDQVIKGVETAVMLLREGQEGDFILPSDMAFGARGVDGLVEPWSPLRYVVKLERVERR